MKTISTYLAITLLSCLCFNANAINFDAVIDLPPRIELSMPVSGIVNKVAVSAGRHVRKDELLVALVEAPFRAEVDLMQSRVDLQQAKLDEAVRDLRHQQEMYDRTVLSTVDLENAQLRVKREKATLAGARAELALANISYRNSRLTAPFDALVLSVDVNEGQALNNTMQSKSLVSLVMLHRFDARFNVTAEQLDGLEVGKPAKVIIGKKQHPAEITAIFHGSAGSGAYMVTAGFTADGNMVTVGKKAVVVIE